MGSADLTLKMALIVAVGVFFASFMDAIAGGGGIISVPTYLLLIKMIRLLDMQKNVWRHMATELFL